MKLIKRGTMWWVDFRMPDGRRRRISTGESDQRRATMRAPTVIADAGAEAPTAETTTLRTALEYHYRTHWSALRSGVVVRRTLDAIERHIGHLMLDKITEDDLLEYATGMRERGKKPATINRHLTYVTYALRRAQEKGQINRVPKAPHYAENNERERYMTPEEEAAVFGWLSMQAEAERVRGDFSKADEWHYVHQLGVFLLDTGFRFSEAFKFTVQQGGADLKNGSTKSGKGRRVPLTERALAAARFLVASPLHERLARMPGKKPWDWITHRWQLATKAGGCPDVTLHILRHTCASRMVQAGVSIYVVSKWLGHASVVITQRYAKLAPDTFAGALAALQGTTTTTKKENA